MRPYRWQDPPPAPVQSIKLRRLTRMLCEPAEFIEVDNSAEFAVAPAPVPSMVIEGVKYVEAPDIRKDKSTCEGCAFEKNDEGCDEAYRMSREVFGGDCSDRSVIYIRKA